MMQNVKLILLAGLVVPSMALAELKVGDTVGTSNDDIRNALEAQGYSISEVEFEDGEIEVEATLGGESYEIELSAESGEILEIETDDDAGTEDG